MIATRKAFSEYYDALIKGEILKNKERRLMTKAAFVLSTSKIFEGMDFTDKKVLDIGGGMGLHAFCAAYLGASEVIILEPEAHGSSSGSVDNIKKLQNVFPDSNVSLQALTFQDFRPEAKKFDIILLHNSINHLNEDACMTLLTDEKSTEIYDELFIKLQSLAAESAALIVRDCSRNNLFAAMKLKNPISPTIEWEKHQSPELWASLLEKHNFGDRKIKWFSLPQLGRVGDFLLGNKAMAHLLQSRFVLTMIKTNEPA